MGVSSQGSRGRCVGCKKSKRKCSLLDESNSPVRGRKRGLVSKVEEENEEGNSEDASGVDGGGVSDAGGDEAMEEEEEEEEAKEVTIQESPKTSKGKGLFKKLTGGFGKKNKAPEPSPEVESTLPSRYQSVSLLFLFLVKYPSKAFC